MSTNLNTQKGTVMTRDGVKVVPTGYKHPLIPTTYPLSVIVSIL